jgi:hypothetical protein
MEYSRERNNQMIWPYPEVQLIREEYKLRMEGKAPEGRPRDGT